MAKHFELVNTCMYHLIITRLLKRGVNTQDKFDGSNNLSVNWCVAL